MTLKVVRIIQSRGITFALVGLSGILVNSGVLALLTDGVGIPYFLSSLIAIELSILNNFLLNDRWTWRDAGHRPFLHRLMRYHGVSLFTALTINWGLLVLLTEGFSWNYHLSNLIGIGAAFLANFTLHHRWTFQPPGLKPFQLTLKGLKTRWIDPLAIRDWGMGGWILLGFVGVRLLLMAQLELLPEEAYYWTYAQNPAWGYFDHPPMVAWVIQFGTTLFGENEFGVRAGQLVLTLLSNLLLYKLSRRCFGQKSTVFTLLFWNLIPLFIGTSSLAFPDGPLIFFWLLALNGIVSGIHQSNQFIGSETRIPFWSKTTLSWCMAGVGIGGALLSKYTGVLLVPSLALFLLWAAPCRHWLRRPQPWLAGLIGLILFSPVIYWNATHDWCSFLFQSGRASGATENALKNFGVFWGIQFGVLGPIPFALFAFTVWKGFNKAIAEEDWVWKWVLSFFVPLFAAFLYAGIKTEVHVNWTAPSFLSLAIGVGGMMCGFTESGLARWRDPWWHATRFWGYGVAGMFTVLYLGLAWGVPNIKIYSRVGGWESLGIYLKDKTEELTTKDQVSPFIIGDDKYNLAAEINFYTQPNLDVVNTYALGHHGLGFRYWTNLAPLERKKAIVVMNSPKESRLAELREHFDTLGPVEEHVMKGPGGKSRSFFFVIGYGYHAIPEIHESQRNQTSLEITYFNPNLNK